jgi:hypothetical protein
LDHGETLDYIERALELFPGKVIRFHWDGLDNPEDYTGTQEEKLEKAISFGTT